MLGSRASLIDCHLNSLIKHIPKDFRVVALAPDQSNTSSQEVIKKYSKRIFFEKRNNSNFSIKSTDATYDFLIEKYSDSKYFLINHDDTIYLNDIETYIHELADNYDFFGAIDNAAKPGFPNPYEKILLDNKPFSQIRIGTWFLGGSVKKYLENSYKVGQGKYEFPVISNLRYWTTRINVKAFRVYTDGGFNFNIRSRLDNNKIKIIDPFADDIAEHFTRLSMGISNRGMSKIVDKDNEQQIWFDRLASLKSHDPKQFKKDKDFLLGILEKFSKYEIKDKLFNKDLLKFFDEI